MRSLQRPATLAGAAALLAAPSFAQTLISDSFEVDTSGDYTVVDDMTPDGTQQFAFDYVAAGIPLAPRSSMGDVGGLRLTANDTIGAADAWTCFHNTAITADQYRMTVDVFMNFQGASGSTEFGHVGVGGDGMRFNSLFTPIEGSGAFIAFTGDGGSGSDYRWFRDSANTPVGGSGSTTLPNSHPSYLGHGSNGTGAFFQSLFPSPPATIAGSPGNIWTTVRIDVDNVAGVISFYFDDQLTFQGNFGGRFDGLVSLGLADVFSSISASNNFTLYDNLLVEEADFSVGTNLCTANANSTGSAASIGAIGSNNTITNNLTLQASGMPDGQFGIFLASRMGGFNVMQPMGSDGSICLDGTIARILDSGTAVVSAGGAFETRVDLTMIPEPNPTGMPIAIQPGETWYFQAWFRDVNLLGNTSNFTDSLEITFE